MACGSSLAMVEERRLRLAAADELFARAAVAWRDPGEPYRFARVQALWAGVAYGRGDLERAVASAVEAKGPLDAVGERRWSALVEWSLGMFAASRGRFGDAALRHRAALPALVEAGDVVWLFKPLVRPAGVAAAAGRPEVAARLLGAADGQFDRTGARLLPFDVPIHRDAASSARSRLGADAFAVARQAGRELGSSEWFVAADTVVAAAGAPAEAAGAAFVRLDGGRVAETWEGPDLAGFPRRLPPVALPAWAGPAPAPPARLRLPPGSRLPDLSSPGPHLLPAVDGAIEVLVDGPATLFVVAADWWAAVALSTRPVRPGAGEALLVGSGVRHAVRPVRPAPAVVLGLAILRPVQDGDGNRRPGKAHSIVSMYGGSAGTIVGNADGATAEVLAAGVGGLGRWSCPRESPSGRSVTRLVLAAGESVPAHLVRGVELVSVDAGPDLRPAEAAVPLPAPQHEDVRPQTASSIRPIDQGFAASDRRADDLRNDGDRPIAVVSFALTTPGIDGRGP